MKAWAHKYPKPCLNKWNLLENYFRTQKHLFSYSKLGHPFKPCSMVDAFSAFFKHKWLEIKRDEIEDGKHNKWIWETKHLTFELYLLQSLLQTCIHNLVFFPIPKSIRTYINICTETISNHNFISNPNVHMPLKSHKKITLLP